MAGFKDLLLFLFNKWRSRGSAPPFHPTVVVRLVAHSNRPAALVAHSNRPVTLIASAE